MIQSAASDVADSELRGAVVRVAAVLTAGDVAECLLRAVRDADLDSGLEDLREHALEEPSGGVVVFDVHAAKRADEIVRRCLRISLGFELQNATDDLVASSAGDVALRLLLGLVTGEVRVNLPVQIADHQID